MSLQSFRKYFKSLSLAVSFSTALVAASCQIPFNEKSESEGSPGTSSFVDVIAPDDLNFIPLNPARGDAAPQAGVLWGDIREDVASGILLRFADGFSSPSHIHNITYRGVVIQGGLHNDDPTAEPMWMGPGSFWTQPAGENHVTSAEPGNSATAFLEILSGPYLVEPSDKAFDNGERPINLVPSNIVWLNPENIEWINLNNAQEHALKPQMTFLWGSPEAGELSGAFIKLPSRFSGSLKVQGGLLRAVVIQGELIHHIKGRTPQTTLPAGGYFSSEFNIENQLTCQADTECIIYVRTTDKFILQ